MIDEKLFVRLGIIYQVEKNKGLEIVDLSGYRDVVEPEIHDMLVKGYLVVENDKYLLGPEGVKLRNKMMQAIDQVRPFEVFANVRTNLQLTEEQSDYGVQVYDDIYDPRFAEGTDGEDLRLCMYQLFGAEVGYERKVNLHLIVFLQKLLDEDFLIPGNFWPNLKLGILATEVNRIVENSVSLEQLGDAARSIYTAGMIEQRKRMGAVCSYCQTPLAILEMAAEENGESLDCCPVCKESFVEKIETRMVDKVVDYKCPNCETKIPVGASACPGCRAVISFSEPPGAVWSETVSSRVVVDEWYESTNYYYHPFDVAVDTLAFVILLDSVW